MKTFKTLALVAALSFAAIGAAEAKGGGHGGGHHSGSSTTSSSSSHSGTGDHYVHSYTRSDGTVVQGYHATNPNQTRNDNYSTRGNVNPYTGQPGTKPRDGEGPQ
jgi:hypothetical protein